MSGLGKYMHKGRLILVPKSRRAPQRKFFVNPSFPSPSLNEPCATTPPPRPAPWPSPPASIPPLSAACPPPPLAACPPYAFT